MVHCPECGVEARASIDGCGDASCCGMIYDRLCQHRAELCSGEGDDECQWCLAPPLTAPLYVPPAPTCERCGQPRPLVMDPGFVPGVQPGDYWPCFCADADSSSPCASASAGEKP